MGAVTLPYYAQSVWAWQQCWFSGCTRPQLPHPILFMHRWWRVCEHHAAGLAR